ncbi:transglutaminase-like domain-containing protein [Tissierella pigra]|uniref:Transglutaminase domain-containing protein n=1 Tax=Tissierella pigra TaxID=2607614 RepID=A0A6N7Y0F9_9FIRM|nr:transglutaminase-like domain-containing protein [Tissierella pigra]MBU5424815.1 transglutaminase-like domain-containing protein [Tissierella pigra]MSU02215.1 transglutaminase domain-containing protein [Tissierella pigra]
MDIYLKETRLLDFNNLSVQKLIEEKGWKELEENHKIREVYSFVRNEIKFGYNKGDDIIASEVLKDGYGQCNTKSILLMALLRTLDIPCRIHGFYIDKKMQKGALTGITYLFAPKKIVHAWTEVYFNHEWIALEGVIIDEDYLNQVKDKLYNLNNGYIGYGISVKDKEKINTCWQGKSTYIQSFSITEDLGIFNSPDDFFLKFNNTNNGFKRFLFDVLRKRINKKLEIIRSSSYDEKISKSR